MQSSDSEPSIASEVLQRLIELRERHGYLRQSDLEALCEETRTPRAVIEELCSFYPHLRREPPANHRLAVCRDLACHMSDDGRSLAALEAACARHNEARPGGELEFEAVSCLGRCELAPACQVDEIPTSTAKARDWLDGDFHTLLEDISPPRREWQVDPYASRDHHYQVLRESLSNPEQIIGRIENSGLRGMGGAGFPTGRKWRLVASEPATPRYVICNADESEPGTFKDRVILDELPHLIIEGMVLAALAIGSREGWIYIRHEYAGETEALRNEIERARSLGALGTGIFGSDFDFELNIFVSPGGYILGEETALLEALEGRRGEPRNKPPFPGIEGLFGQPTLINNVETFAHVPRILRTGRADLKFFSVSGDVAKPGVLEVELGASLRDLLDACGGMAQGRELEAFLPGGASTGFLGAAHANIPMTWDALGEVGSALGSGAVVIVGSGRDLLSLAGNLTAFFRNETCGKCVPCRIGTQKAVELIEIGDDESLARIPGLHEVMSDTSICGLGQAALIPVTSVLEMLSEGTLKTDRDGDET